MKRYEPELIPRPHWSNGDDSVTMTEDPEGEWVRYDDVEAELERLRAIIRDGVSEETKRELLEGVANAVVASAFGPLLESEAVKRLIAEVERLRARSFTVCPICKFKLDGGGGDAS